LTRPIEITFSDPDFGDLTRLTGTLVATVGEGGELSPAGKALDEACAGAISRLAASAGFKCKLGDVEKLLFPMGLTADAVLVVGLGSEPLDAAAARRIGGAIGARTAGEETTFLADGLGDPALAAEAAFGAVLRRYAFVDHKTGDQDDVGGALRVRCPSPDEAAKAAQPLMALADGVFFTRDLVNEPANVLTTEAFAARLATMSGLGLEISVLDEDALEAMGMRALLAVGRGSASGSKVVTMKWMGGGDEAPLALIGKGVTFDTGGVSLKPAAGMEEMTTDMGGAGVVAGVMRALAKRKAKANVVGIVGLVENMPDGMAQRPGDVVRSMKGDTIEVINTDAEGRLVLADVMWHAQEAYKPAAMIDLATLTGAIVVALGAENAGYFASDDDLAAAFGEAAKTAGENAWRMPLSDAYDKLLKSRVADVKNVGGRPAGAITAAQFLKRFVKEGVPWIHVDIAGVTSTKENKPLSPKGATGWGVRTLDQLIRDKFEG